MSGFAFPLTLPTSWQSTGTAQFWSALDRIVRGRLYVGRPDGRTWVDLSDYLCAAKINLGDVAAIGTGPSGVDAVVRQAEITLMQSRPEVDSFNPRDRASSWNQFGGVYSPLLWPNREVILDLAACPIDREPADTDWVRVFRGYMGDSIQASSENGRITVQCRDLSKRLQDCYIETSKQYGSTSGTPAETVIQQLLDDNLGAGKVTVYCPVSPGFMITPYTVEYVSLWDAVQAVATQIGWFLGYRWWPDINDFRLTLMPPPRNKTAAQYDYAFDLDDIRVQELDITDRDVRNAVKVTYRDSATGQRATVTVEDAASIAEYGRRAMQIEEADTSLIDTAAEAQALADAALWDLKDLTATTRITMPFMPTMDVFAGVVVTNPRLSSTQDFFAVETVEHALDWSDKERFQGSTEIVASGRVVGAHGKWLAMQTRPGAAEPVRTGKIAPSAVDATKIAPGAVGTDTIATGGVKTSNISPGAVTSGYSVSKTETQAITTTSTVYVEIFDLTQAINLPEACKTLVLFRSNVNCDQNGYSTDARLQIDGINYYESRFTSSTGFTTGNLTNLQLVDLAAGSHTFKVFWKTTAGTSTMHTRQFIVLVLRR